MLSGPKIWASRSSSASASASRLSDERPRHPPREAAGEREQPRRMALEQLPVDAWLVVVALEVAERAELDQVPVARVVRGEQREVRVPLRLRPTVVDDVDLAAEDRLDPLLASQPCEARSRPAIEPWSVSDTAGISSSAAFRASAGIRHAPSRIEYSEWTCRWTNGALTGRPSYCPHWTAPARAEPPRRPTGRSISLADSVPADNEGMRQIPISLKLLAVLSLLAEATAAALVFWHTGPRAR